MNPQEPEVTPGFGFYNQEYFKKALKSKCLDFKLPWVLMQDPVYKIVESLYSEGWCISRALDAGNKQALDECFLENKNLVVPVRLKVTDGVIKPEKV
jgi:hypothetical protein